MSVCGVVFDADARKRAATGTQLAGSVQWTALDNPHRGAVADAAQRPAAVVHRTTANPTLAGGRGVRADGR